MWFLRTRKHFSRGGNFDTKNSVRTRAGKPVFPQHFPSSPKTHDCSVYNVFERNPRNAVVSSTKHCEKQKENHLFVSIIKMYILFFKKCRTCPLSFCNKTRFDRLLIIGTLTVVIWICNDFVQWFYTARSPDRDGGHMQKIIFIPGGGVGILVENFKFYPLRGPI